MEGINLNLETINRLLEVGGTLGELRDLADGSNVAIVPNGFKVERFTDADKVPECTRRAPQFFDTGSFIEYVTTFKLEGQTRIFVSPDELKAVAVIDYDSTEAPDRGVHRATLRLGLSPEWIAWRDAAAQTKQRGFSQEDFAEFLEERAPEVRAPTAAELIELVTKMQITRQVVYKRAVRLQDGRQQFTFTNENEAGSMEFPSRLELGIPVFKGGQPYKIEVLMRYRLNDSNLRFALVIHRADEILADAIKGDIAAIATATGVPVHIGSIA